MKIETVGLEQYAPGGSARVQVLVVGGPGVGKTRWSSFFPDPIYADCENGMASVADRGVQRVRVTGFRDMLGLLVLLKEECKKPVNDRRWKTLVVDTVDAFQRTVMEEWHELNPRGTNNKYDVWNYVSRCMGALTTRALNLDMDVVMLVHESTKTDEDDRVIHSLQLKGGGKEEIFNDFDLVGWLRTEWAAVDGERQQRRLLTFQPRPGREWLKDRLHLPVKEFEVTFSDSDYNDLFMAVLDGVDELEPAQLVAEVPDVDPDDPEPEQPSEDVVQPGVAEGALPPQPPAIEKLSDLTKAQLLEKAAEVGANVSTGMLKAEVLAAVQAAVDSQGAEAPTPVEPKKTEAEQLAEAQTAEAADQEEKPEPETEEEPKHFCEECGADLASETADYVRLAWIKYRKKLCDTHFLALRNA